MKTEILKLLRGTDGYVSGQQISEMTGVSRTAVWKTIRRLQEEGYRVEAVRNRGYRIVDGPDVMTKEELESLMKTRWAGKNIVYYDVTDSTNLRIRQLGDEGAPHGTLAVADRQTAGRGRRGRSWESPAGSSIYMSVLLRPEIPPDKAAMLTLVMACSVAEGIRGCLEQEVSGEIPRVQIKWPNDIIINGKKLVGILTEMSSQIDYINHVTVGVGINVNMTEFPEAISQTATSLRLECGHCGCVGTFRSELRYFHEDAGPFRPDGKVQFNACKQRQRGAGHRCAGILSGACGRNHKNRGADRAPGGRNSREYLRRRGICARSVRICLKGVI